ncbi:DUF1624 domain-containing protein [Hyunsoonleella flava]|uniref:DUF1624 domain-containing protein n=1 Tax=Hyunsoonleella flava TaxID=2527939 RepID=A0A4Q9FH48_9FLAO|nr:heparan-alpha-glucosaminide N-acetyltransferase domain-containing protein [Hyunsoonleella flava]TBN06388.1 DUF1624 domain-containing protein [Hyunsoonleella flava]
MPSIKSSRIESIDILRGLVMVLMALDHTRDYFHYGSFFSDPTDLETTTPFLFFTRFVTHFCAPVFVFLAGTSAFLYGRKKSTSALFKFLITRGFWLVFLEIVVNNFFWWFDVTYSFIVLQVIWAIGVSMIALSFLILIPRKLLLGIGLLIVFGHNLLDSIQFQGNSFQAILWYVLHQGGELTTSSNSMIGAYYPVLPWIGIIVLGYCFGYLYQKDVNDTLRKKWLLYLGFGTTLLFFVVRGFNIYGDPVPWTNYDLNIKTVMSFFNVTKYPPSLAYASITLGPSFLFLLVVESIKNKVSLFLLAFGRVPLFFYFIHILVIHLLAIIGILIFGGNWKDMILTYDVFMNAKLLDYGYSLFIVYLVWIFVVTLLYFPSKTYMAYKANNKDKWWLSYL